MLARGFKEPGEPDEETGQYPPDTEIENDPDDFEKEAHEKEIFKTIFDASIGQIYLGNWTDLPNEEAEIQISTGLVDLLVESRRLPEIVVYVSVSEKEVLERVLDKSEIERVF